MDDKESRKIRDDIIQIPAIFFVNNILLSGNEYEIRLNKLPKISEKSFLKLKTILNERHQKQMEIAIVCFELKNSLNCLREWGVLARIISLSEINALFFDLRVRIMGCCRVLRFYQNEEQDDCFFADVKISPIKILSEAAWRSDGIQRLRNDIIEDFYEFSAVCAEISIMSADNIDSERKFYFMSLFSQKTAISLEFCLNFAEFIKIISEWLEDVCLEKETVFNYKFRFLSLNDEYKQILMMKDTINNLIGMAEKELLILLKENSSFFRKGLPPEKKNFSAESGQSPEKSERDFSAAQKELLERLEEVLKKLNALKKNLGGDGNDAEI